MHVCFQMIFPHECNLLMAMTSTHCRRALFTITFCGQMKHALWMRVCSSITTVTSVHRIIVMGISFASASAFVLESFWDIIIGPCLLPDWWTIAWFSGNCSTGAASSCASSCQAQVVVLACWSSSTLCGRCPTVVQCNIRVSREVNWMSRVNCMASFNGFFPVGMLEGARFYSPSQNYRWTCHKISSSCVDVDANTLRHI